MRSIRVGKQKSDFMVVAIHSHQNSFSYQAYSHDNSTPDFLIELAHKAIDNGADVFVGHGVHTRGAWRSTRASRSSTALRASSSMKVLQSRSPTPPARLSRSSRASRTTRKCC